MRTRSPLLRGERSQSAVRGWEARPMRAVTQQSDRAALQWEKEREVRGEVGVRILQ